MLKTPHRCFYHQNIEPTIHIQCGLPLFGQPRVRYDGYGVLPGVRQHQVPELQGARGAVQRDPVGIFGISDVGAGGGDDVVLFEAPAD